MTDVPGHSRGIVAPLQAAGVRLLDVGINAASVPPEVPDAFLWKDAEGNSLPTIYHRHDYGSLIQIPGSDLAVAVEVRNDNGGPHTLDEITAIYAGLRARYPGAKIEASNLSEVAHAVAPYREDLPVVTEEIGDTWIYGIPSDPKKVARFREVSRMRRTWISSGHFAAGDAKDRQFLRRFLLAVEHTWGTDTKSYLDNTHYRPADLAASLGRPGYLTMLTSWQEKRDDIDLGIAALPPALREEVRVRMKTIAVTAPSVDGLVELDPKVEMQGKHYLIALDPETGAITKLVRRSSGRDWASPDSPLALITYQTLSAEDFADYLDRYVQIKADWAPRDFGKPGIQSFGAKSQEWHPKLIRAWTSVGHGDLRVVLHLQISDSEALATGNVAWPVEFYLEMILPEVEPTIQLHLTSLGKAANRMPEALWLSFIPPEIDAGRCTLTKVDEAVTVTDVVRGGGRSMHAVNGPISFGHADGVASLQIDTLDAAVVALGVRSPLNYSPELPDMQKGAHVSLFNNAWGTNYPQWGSGDWLYRFTIRA